MNKLSAIDFRYLMFCHKAEAMFLPAEMLGMTFDGEKRRVMVNFDNARREINYRPAEN